MTTNAIQETTGAEHSQANETAAQPSQKKLWCNFCGYESDDLIDYLAHSCVTVLEQKGQAVVPTGQNECR
jgi:hypothetical protein